MNPSNPLNPLNDIDKVYIINLRKRTDRWKLCEPQLKQNNITNYERFDAIKPDLKNIDKIQYSRNNLKRNQKYIIGALGCKLSHLEIIKNAKNNKYNKILILEDDFLLTNNFGEKYKKIMENIKSNNLEFDMLYLGFSIVRQNPYTNTTIQNIKKLTNGHTTHAYIMNSTFFDEAIQEISTCYCEIDVCYANMQKKYDKIYGVYPCLITQRESFSDIMNRKVNYNHCISLDKE